MQALITCLSAEWQSISTGSKNDLWTGPHRIIRRFSRFRRRLSEEAMRELNSLVLQEFAKRGLSHQRRDRGGCEVGEVGEQADESRRAEGAERRSERLLKVT